MSAVQQIEAAYARNLAVQRSRLAAIPEVGIFWMIDNKLVADSIPWRQADIYGGFNCGKNIMRPSGPRCSGSCPNGKGWRILITRAESSFSLYSSLEIVNSPALRKMILAEFKLLLGATKFEAYYHYENVMPAVLDEDFDA